MKRILLLIAMALPYAAQANLPSDSKSALVNGVDCDRVRNNELVCLACNIFHESGNQSIHGKIAVGAVTINRVLSEKFPKSICEVVWDPYQFSWTHDGKSDRTIRNDWWLQSLDIAYGFFIRTNKPHGAFVDPTNCALFYHADYRSEPYWVKGDNMIASAKIETHIFYQQPSLGCPYTQRRQIGQTETKSTINSL